MSPREGMETTADALLEDALILLDGYHQQGGSFVAEWNITAAGGGALLTTPDRPARLKIHRTANFSRISGFGSPDSAHSGDAAPSDSAAGHKASFIVDSPPSGLTRAICEYPSDMLLLPPASRPRQPAQAHNMRRGLANRPFFVQPL